MASRLLALNPDLAVSQYLHTSWTSEEGIALPPIQALAQTGDGYLWMGTSNGLMRFDGMRFVEWSPLSGPALPSTDIRSLRSASGGGLWVGTSAGVGRMDRDRLQLYPAAAKLPCGQISSMLEDRSGALWILYACPSTSVVARLLPDGTFKRFGAAEGLPKQVVHTLFLDRQSNLWIGTARGLCRWSPGSPAVCPANSPVNAVSIAESATDGLLVLDGKRNQLLSGAEFKPLAPPMRDSSVMPGVIARDHDGNTWIGSTGQGLARVRAGNVDWFNRKEGLSNNLVTSILEDHEGDLWVGTARGIDRLRDPKVLQLSSLNGLSGDLIDAVASARDGAIWIGTIGSGLDRVVDHRTTQFSVAAGLPNAVVASLFEDASQHLWVGTSEGLAVQRGDRFVEVLTDTSDHLRRVFNIGGNQRGAIWLADNTRGLFTIRDGIACTVETPGIDAHDIYRLLVAHDGAVWLGHFNGGVSVISDGPAKQVDTRDGLAAGGVRAIYEDREGAIWVGTATGLSRFQNGRWTTWTAAQSLPEGGVQGIVEDSSDGLWLITAAGVLRVDRISLNGPAKTIPYILYGATEGLRLIRNGAMTNPRITRAADGRLWLCTEDGVAVIDPARVRRNQVAPPVVIEQLTVDGIPLDIDSPHRVAFRGRELQITYTGISLMVPERVHIRYRMDGLDHDWREAGARRSVDYVNLSPGDYRFRVIAANNDGVWNQIGAELPLRIDPYFYQTRWFMALCLAAIMMVAWGIHWLNLRRVISRFRLVAAERARFGRELHDSLLQGFLGVVYQLQAASHQMTASPDASKKRLDQAIEQAEQSLREARQMIISMKIPALENSTLPEALSVMFDQATSGMSFDFEFDVTGRARPCHYEVEANLFLIAREAVTNSMNHAAPTRIRVELAYTSKQLSLTIEDDGVGFDPDKALVKEGHQGFRGMRERAEKIGAAFRVESAPGRGSRIEVTIPWKKASGDR